MASDTPGWNRGKPALFNSELFGSPAPSGSDGLSSLGLGNDVFNSPFSLAPAAPAEQRQSPSATPPNRSPRRSPETTRHLQPAVVGQGISENDPGELSTIPLDSPSLVQMSAAASTAMPTRSISSSAGWNDPPMLSQFSSPLPAQRSSSQPLPAEQDIALGSGYAAALDSSYPVQPLAGRTTEVPSSVSSGPPVVTQTSSSNNPYRMGGAAKRSTALGYTTNQPPVSFPAATASSLPPPPQPSLQPQPAMMAPQPQPAVVTSSTSFPTAHHNQQVEQQQHQYSVLPVRPHWFYLRNNEQYWFPFSLIDSGKLEEAFIRSQANPSQEYVVSTDGGRYDVHLSLRQKRAVYWEEPAGSVRRCSWFYKGEENRWYMPYTEEEADKLEQTFVSAATSGSWNQRVEMSGGDAVIMHSPNTFVHYTASHFQPMSHEVDYRPRVVARGFAEINQVDPGEDRVIDHVVFVVHGIGPLAELSFRNLVDAVDDFREVSQLILKTHRFSKQAASGGRVEFLPIHWHTGLLGDSSAVDSCVRSLTLPSVSRLREYTSSTLIDLLFYTSPFYCQIIVDHVSSEMNRLFDLFKQRNSTFTGGVSVMGHSLGSCILFDLLSHQGDDSNSVVEQSTSLQPTLSSDTCQQSLPQAVPTDTESSPNLADALGKAGLSDLVPTLEKEQIDFESLLMLSGDDLKEMGIPMGPRKKLSSYIVAQTKLKEEQRVVAEQQRLVKIQEEEQRKQQQVTDSNLRDVKYVTGVGGVGQPLVNYPRLKFDPCNLFTLGSPVALILTARGVDALGSDYQLPTCNNVFNIFHPHDPVAYRLEPLVCASPPAKAVLMAHHKGRKRFHLELYENLERAGASVKQYLVDGIRNMWQQLNELARAHSTDQTQEHHQENEIDDTLSSVSGGDLEQDQLPANLNQNRRLDYVLQERPIERLNEHLFAIGSHLGYWRSEDTALLLLKEIYQEPHPQLIKS